MRNVLFLCTGNYYRSRFAEVLFNHLAAEQHIPWHADSRGLALERGIHNVGPMAASALAALRDLGVIHVEPRFPLSATLQCFQVTHLVVALKEAEHRPLLLERFTGWEDRVTYWHVHDTDELSPTEALAQIEQLVQQLVNALQS